MLLFDPDGLLRFKVGGRCVDHARDRGLGPTLARQLQEMHGGRIRAGSDGPGLGSTFTIELPALAGGSREEACGGDAQLAELIRGRHILIVDDDPDALDVLTSRLQGEAAHVTAASSARDAPALVQRHRPNLLISSLAMPDQDGYWLVEQRRLPPRKRPHPGVGSAPSRPRLPSSERAAGFAGHVSKPLRTAELLEVLRTELRWSPGAAPPGDAGDLLPAVDHRA